MESWIKPEMIERISRLVGQNFIAFKDSPELEKFKENVGNLSDEQYPLRASMNRIDENYKVFKELLFDLAIIYEPKTIVELGVREGRSSDAFLRALLTMGRGQLYSFDPGNENMLERHNLPDGWPGLWTFHKMMGEHGFEQYAATIGPVDLLFIDTDPHNYEQTKMWTKHYWVPAMSPGSIIIWDDCAPQHQAGISAQGKAWDPGAAFGTLPAVLEYIDEHYDNLAYAFSIGNVQSNGHLVIKIK